MDQAGSLEGWWEQNTETIMEMANFKYIHALQNPYVVDIIFFKRQEEINSNLTHYS